jgi:tetratricopeptide (TPR) repeat protein
VRSAAALLVVTWLAAAAAAPAGSPALAIEFQAGVDAFRLGKYDDARRHLESAEAFDPKLSGPHRFLAAVARAQRRWADCITEARRALLLNPRSQELAETRRLHDDCRGSAGRPAIRVALGDSAAISVTANVTGAIVRIGGLRYGGTPLAPRPIRPGSHEVAIEKPGYRPAYRSIDALPGIVTDLEIELEPEPPASSVRPR